MTPATLVTLAAMAGAVGWTLALALPGPPAYLAGVMAAQVVVVAVFRRLDRSRGRLMAVGEGVAVLLIPVTLVTLDAAADAATLFVGFIAGLVAWLIAQITVSDLDAVVDPVDAMEGVSTAPERLRGRFLWIGAAQAIAVVAGFGGLTPPLEPRPPTGWLVASYGLYWIVGMAALSSVERRRSVVRWQRDGTVVDTDVESRWTNAGATLLVGAVLASIVAMVLGRDLLGSAHIGTTWVSAILASTVAWLTGNNEREVPPNQIPPTAEEFRPVGSQPIEATNPRGDWVDFVMLVVFALIFLGVYLLFVRRRRGVDVARPASAWKAVWRILRDLGIWLAGLPATLAGWWRQRGKRISAVPSRRFQRERSQPWKPADPFRRRIAAEFRSYLQAAEKRDLTLMPSETASEFGYRLGTEGLEAVRSLTDLYGVARYSEHILGQPEVEAAGKARRQAIADLEKEPE